MSKALDAYVTVLDYAEEILLVLSGASIGISLFSFTTVIGEPFGIPSPGITLVFLVTNRFAKMFLKKTREEKK